MTYQDVLNTIREKGVLLDRGVFELVSSFDDVKLVKEFIEKLERESGQKIITKALLTKNYSYLQNVVGSLDSERKQIAEKIVINLGISFEISKEKELSKEIAAPIEVKKSNYEMVCPPIGNDKKLEVADFVGHFRARYQQLQRILMARTELQNLISLNKLSNNRQSFSFIGIVIEKRITKNKNLIVRFEDLTGEIAALIKFDNGELFQKGEELQLDDVVGVKASGNRDMVFVHDIIFPDASAPNKTRFDEDVSVAFVSDIHCGSDRHLGKNFELFLDWLNSEDINAKKIKFLFFVGDNVDGVGTYPGQENLLDLKSMKEQYELLSRYVRRVPQGITMFMCPGQHDAVRVAEPQPPIIMKYAPQLYEIGNLNLVTNPTLVKLFEGEKEFRVLMYHGASIHGFINEIKELRLAKAHTTPAKAVKHMLKRRHLAPTHGNVVYIPNQDKDPLVISEVPDVLCTGEVHRLDIENHNGVLIITGSCWQAQTSFEEKVGNIPDPCKVPVLNLKTRELKIFDFSKIDGEKKEER